jgi:hypothetical protein
MPKDDAIAGGDVLYTISVVYYIHTTLNGSNVCRMFDIAPPTLEQYLSDCE